MTPLEVVKACLQAYTAKDRAAIEELIAEDYSFTSPLDNKLNRENYFAICWPNSKGITGFDLKEAAQSGDTVFIVYEGHAEGSKVFRNAELHKVSDGKLVSTEVYFGWNVPHPVAEGQHKDNASGGQS